jgi:hypothetical protein
MDPLVKDQIQVDREYRRVVQEIDQLEREIHECGSIWPRRRALCKAKEKLRDIEEVQQLVRYALYVERTQITGSPQVTIRWDRGYLPINTYGYTGVMQT